MIITLKLWRARRRVVAILKSEEAARNTVTKQRRLLADLEEAIERLEVQTLTAKHFTLQDAAMCNGGYRG